MKQSLEKVLFYFDSPFYSGAEMQGVRNAQGLIADGHSVTVAFRESANLGSELRVKLNSPKTSFFSFGSPSKDHLGRSNPIVQFLEDPWVIARSFFWGMRVISQEKPGVIHVNNGGYPGASGSRGFALAAILRSRGARLIFTVNNQAVPYTSPSRWPQAPLDFLLSRSRINWVTGSVNAASTLSRVLRLRKSKVHPIRNGPKPKCTCNGHDLDPSVKFDPFDIVALQVGHLEPRKGQRTLIEAVNELKKSNRLPSNWIFVIEGDGAMKRELEGTIAHYGLESQVKLPGRVRCIFHLFLASHVLVHPSVDNDDLPNVVSEAMSLGLPVIASDIAGLPEQIIDGSSGILIKPGDYKMLSESVFKIMSSWALRDKMGSIASERYISHFSEAIALEAFRELYFSDEGRFQ
jgi:glycosyltransferase involved in cell wall biosynthesis